MRINKEIEKILLPQILLPLRHEEYEQLEESLLAEGCRDPLVLWGDILIDGHNRYDICSKHNIPFKTVARDFGDISEVFDWVEDNQLGRRNLTPTNSSYCLAGNITGLKISMAGIGEQVANLAT